MRLPRTPGTPVSGMALLLLVTGAAQAAPSPSPTTVLASSPVTFAQAGTDQVFWVDARGREKTWRGTIEENSLTRTTIDASGSVRKVDNAVVRRVEFGEVPPAYTEATAYFDRGDYEPAAARFQVAAGDASTREVVRANARLRAAEAWMRLGKSDISAFEKAVAQLQTFLSDHATDRSVPRARLALGRAQWLAEDLPGARATLLALYQSRSAADANGFDDATCFEAGILAAQAALAADDADAARALFGEISPAVSAARAPLDAADPSQRSLASSESTARLGEGFCLLASGSVAQARTFFNGKLNSTPDSDALRFGARLGLAEAYLAEGDTRKAQLEFAQVSAIDHTDRARVARALVGLSECYLKLPDSSGRENAKRLLATVQEHYGDTPSVLKARSLSKTL